MVNPTTCMVQYGAVWRSIQVPRRVWCSIQLPRQSAPRKENDVTRQALKKALSQKSNEGHILGGFGEESQKWGTSSLCDRLHGYSTNIFIYIFINTTPSVWWQTILVVCKSRWRTFSVCDSPKSAILPRRSSSRRMLRVARSLWMQFSSSRYTIPDRVTGASC